MRRRIVQAAQAEQRVDLARVVRERRPVVRRGRRERTERHLQVADQNLQLCGVAKLPDRRFHDRDTGFRIAAQAMRVRQAQTEPKVARPEAHRRLELRDRRGAIAGNPMRIGQLGAQHGIARRQGDRFLERERRDHVAPQARVGSPQMGPGPRVTRLALDRVLERFEIVRSNRAPRFSLLRQFDNPRAS